VSGEQPAQRPPAAKEKRRLARVCAVQHLYACEMRGVLVPGLPRDKMPAAPDGEAATEGFAAELLGAALERLPEIDRLLRSALQNWELGRLGAVDRAILRVAAAELLSRPEIPAAVTINEAIEIARSHGSADSAKFVNGVLDRVRKEIGREPRATTAR
jgi:N utilization substance protein B